jgi:hypothetical protein
MGIIVAGGIWLNNATIGALLAVATAYGPLSIPTKHAA